MDKINSLFSYYDVLSIFTDVLNSHPDSLIKDSIDREFRKQMEAANTAKIEIVL